MASVRPIRITSNDKQEYARLVRNARNKITRTRNKYGVELIGEVQLPKLESFATRAEFNKWKDSIKSFTNRNNTRYQFVENKYGVIASKAEINKITRDTERAQRVAKKLAKDAANKPFIAGGKVQGTVGQQMLQMGKPETAGIVIPPKFDFNKINTRKQLEAKKKSMEERSSPEFFDKRMERMKENFIEALNKTFNSDAHELANMIKSLSPRDFYEMYLEFEEFKFAQIYLAELTGQDTDDYVEKLKSDIELYKRGVNKDLRGF